MIEVSQLKKVYAAKEPVVAVDGVTFTASSGRIFGLLGPNGAGKTTTLRIIATVLQATSGSVRVDGIEVKDDPAAVRARVGFLSASTGVYERLTAREQLQYFGRLHGLPEDYLNERIAALATELDMEPFLERACGLLSTGQKQKVSIARALVHDPPVLIFDEPTSGLDVLVARAVVERISALRDPRRTIVLSSHIMSEVERLCDELAIIHRGRIWAQGTLDEVKQRAGAESLEEAFFTLIDRQSEDRQSEDPNAS